MKKLRPLHFVKQTFTDLSGFKKRFLQLALLLLILGAGFQAWALTRGEPSTGWTSSALTGGAGAILGFVVGACIRLVTKIGLLVAGAVAGVTWGLGHFGLIDLPWDSYGRMYDAFTSTVDRQTTSLHTFLDGYLPSGGLTGVGLLTGFTQRPGGDDEDEGV